MNERMLEIFPEPFDEDGRPRQSGIVGSSQALRSDRPVPAGGNAGTSEGRHDRIKTLAHAYGAACRVQGSGEAVRRAWTAFVSELERKA